MAMQQVDELDPKQVRQFGGRLFGIITDGLLTLLIDIGEKTGLFESAAVGPATSQELADRAGLNERYVREWLGAMTTAGIFTYDPAAQRYTLPPAHAACLTGETSANLAPSAQTLAVLARQVSKLTACFRDGGGVPYTDYQPEMADVLDGGERRLYDQYLLTNFLPVTPDLPARLEQGIRVTDIGCGNGHCVNLMARAFPRSQVVGYDIGEAGLARGEAEAAAWGLKNARFERLDVTQLPATPGFDLITAFDAIHDQVDPAAVLHRVHEALAPNGIFLMFDVKAASALEENLGNRIAPYIYAVSTLHCMTVSLAEGGAGLGTAWGIERARQMLAEAGFTQVEVVDTPRPANCIYICR